MIEKARLEDLPEILGVYEAAREFMRTHGNSTQWGTTYPTERMLREDIAAGELYIIRENGAIHGCFLMMERPEPTYQVIDGAWKTDGPYLTLHRVAGDGQVRGVFDAMLDFAKARSGHIRLDTHHNNVVMQHLAERSGFQRCGIVYMEDGTPRIAYEWFQ